MVNAKVKVKVKKKKLKIKKLLITIFIFIVLFLIILLLFKMPLKNIYVVNNNLVSDKEIISLSELSSYPSYVGTYFINIEDNILKNKYIKNVKIVRKFPSKIVIQVEEYKPICIYNNKVVLSSSNQLDNVYNIDYLPYVINNIDSVYDEFVKKFSEIDNSVFLKISEIEYAPNDIDDDRFLLYMTDSNLVYITLSKISKLNKYNKIVNELNGKIGIIYLDSGDYVEIKG